MPVAERQPTTSFQTGISSTVGRTYAPPLTTRPTTTPPTEARPTTKIKSKTAPRVEMHKLVLMSLVAALAVACGLVYFAGHAQVAQEGYRRVKLQHLLTQEQEQAKQWKQRLDLTHNSGEIQKKALAINMVRPNEKQTLAVGSGE